MLMLSAVPTGLAILDTVPTDKSVGCFHLPLWDKIPIYKKVGMHLRTFARCPRVALLAATRLYRGTRVVRYRR